MVLVTGLTMAVIAAVVEFVWNSRRNASHDKVSNNILIWIQYMYCRHGLHVHFIDFTTLCKQAVLVP